MGECEVSIDDIKAMCNKIIQNINIEGFEREDLLMEGVISGLEAIKTYDKNRNVKMSTHVYSCIKYRMLYLSRYANAQKRKPDKRINFDMTIIEETGAFYGQNLIVLPTQEKDFEFRELKENIMKSIQSFLKEEEIEIVNMMIEGYSTNEIAEKLNCTNKKMANKINYIKRKVRQRVEF